MNERTNERTNNN